MEPRLIGLVGRSRVGKDTVAGLFTETHAIRRLALPVKDACKVLYGWSDIEVESALKETKDAHWGVTPRYAMMHLTQSMRTFMGTDFFTRRFFDTIKEHESLIIPDVRFYHDVLEIHKRGGVTIKIVREGASSHDFEEAIDDLHTTFEVENNGTIDELKAKIAEITRGNCKAAWRR